MNTLFKLAAVSFAASLAACQHTAPSQIPEPVDPVPPVVGSQGASAAPAAAARVAPQPRPATVITLHLAQQQQEASLIEVDAGGKAPLYALPRPVLIQSDIGRVSPVDTPQGSFVLLEMNERGIPKLHSITQQARGHYLLLSVQGQLVSVARIGESIRDGRLLVPTQSLQHSRAIVRAMRGGS